MQNFPHNYVVQAQATETGNVTLTSEGAPDLASAPPREFGGPGDQWSPESLLVAAVADCFILTFRAIARASRFDWLSLSCEVDGTLEKIERATLFTDFLVHATLTVAGGTDEQKAMRLLQNAERGCLITNSMKAETRLQPELRFQ